MPEESFTVLFQYGLAGVVILGLSMAVKSLYSALIAEKEKRVQDAIEAREKLTEPLANIATSISLIDEKIETSKARRR